jgi:hydrogenase-4 component B
VLEPLGLAPTSVSPFAVALLLGVLALVVSRLRRGRAAERVAPSWSGGTRATADQQYTALGFTQPLRLVFEPVLRPERGVEVLEGDSPWFARRLRHRSVVPPWFERTLYRPLVHALLWWSERARRLQAGSLHLYLAYLLATLVALLVWAR